MATPVRCVPGGMAPTRLRRCDCEGVGTIRRPLEGALRLVVDELEAALEAGLRRMVTHGQMRAWCACCSWLPQADLPGVCLAYR